MRPNRLTPVLAAAILPLALLIGCGKSQDATNAVPEPPADAPAELPAQVPANVTAPAPATDYSRPINMLGTEPFWALKVRPEGLVLSLPDEKDQPLKNPGPVVEGSKANWTSEGLAATLTPGPCSDDMSEQVYPFKSEVKWKGRTLTGCATYADGALPAK